MLLSCSWWAGFCRSCNSESRSSLSDFEKKKDENDVASTLRRVAETTDKAMPPQPLTLCQKFDILVCESGRGAGREK